MDGVERPTVPRSSGKEKMSDRPPCFSSTDPFIDFHSSHRGTGNKDGLTQKYRTFLDLNKMLAFCSLRRWRLFSQPEEGDLSDLPHFPPERDSASLAPEGME